MKTLTSIRPTARQALPPLATSIGRTDTNTREISLEPKLLEMVRLRVAQICNCSLCMDVYTGGLKALGESGERIRQLKSWRQSALYSARERTALAVGEALGANPPTPVSKDVVRAARALFSDAEILQLTLTIFAVNDWNHLCVH